MLVDDRETEFCFLDPHMIVLPAFMKAYPDTEVRSELLAKLGLAGTRGFRRLNLPYWDG